MFNRLHRGLKHTAALITAWPSSPKRTLLKQIMAFSRALPPQFNHPLPEMMAFLTPGDDFLLQKNKITLDDIRQLADAVAAWHLTSPLGICLRRSLLRYHFLRRAGLPVQIVFGARLKHQAEGGGIGGHAWLILNGLPYHENPGDYEDFTPIYTYPADSS